MRAFRVYYSEHATRRLSMASVVFMAYNNTDIWVRGRCTVLVLFGQMVVVGRGEMIFIRSLRRQHISLETSVID